MVTGPPSRIFCRGVGGSEGGVEFEGGCRCGTVRIEARGRPDDVIYCRGRAAPPSRLPRVYREERAQTRRGTPKVYESSTGGVRQRSFSGDCGAPLSYIDERLEGEVYLHVGAFEDPEPFEPEVHDPTPKGWAGSTSKMDRRGSGRSANRVECFRPGPCSSG